MKTEGSVFFILKISRNGCGIFWIVWGNSDVYMVEVRTLAALMGEVIRQIG